MRYRVELAIMPKKGTLDPQGETVGRALDHMGYEQLGTKIGAYIAYESMQPEREAVNREANEMFFNVFTRSGGSISVNTHDLRILSISELEEKAE